MSKFSNLLKLTEMLKEKKMGCKELAKELDVSERMVRKYILDIKEAEVNLETTPGRNGGYFIPPKEEKKIEEPSKLEVRITYIKEEEKNNLIEYILKDYNIPYESRTYLNNRSENKDERRVYITLNKKTS
ncbi:helix-turn-helix domain-containing protein [Clostridium sp.]|uniref:helix-turn-helix domain-containing protein n=1 Tax=Clostridium sp. TaxID=1506 RepID=UPI002FC86BF5